MTYWLHHCSYENGLEYLKKENKLTIGFSDCALNDEMLDAILRKDGRKFDEVYAKVYSGKISRSRWSLWYFTCIMKADDIVVVPWFGGFTVCKLNGTVRTSPLKNECDIGFEWSVEVIADQCSPREAYASTSLLSRMKCRQTTLNINDLKNDIDEAIKRFNEKKPFSLLVELSEKCHAILNRSGSPDHFESLILDYFTRLGAKAEILPKNSSSKAGDCDVSAVFHALRLTISVQAKKHVGTTDDWAVKQIVEYANSLNENNGQESNWSYVNWVVSLADDFTDEAKQLAHGNGVILLNGADFCRMLVSNGIG